MNTDVLTPVTQAMRDGTLTRRELKQLMRRSDRPALLRLLVWCVIVATGIIAIWLAQGSWLIVPAMFFHGVVLVHHFSLQHECCHYTAFKTRWLNDVVGNVCGLIIMLPNRFFRYEHCDHHTYTQIKGKDTELIEMPQSKSEYLWYISSVPYWKAKLGELWRHALGNMTFEEKRFVPVSERRMVILEARCMAGFYAAVIILGIVYQSDAALWFWFLPVVLGEPVMRAIRMTEHVGRPMVGDMTTNTRSNRISGPLKFLCWNMNYHAEHHYAASVRFHALPALSEKLDGYVHTEKDGYFGAHRDIVRQLFAHEHRR